MASPDPHTVLAEPLRTATGALEPVLEALDRGDNPRETGNWREAWEHFAREAGSAGLEPVDEFGRFLVRNVDSMAAIDPQTAPAAGAIDACIRRFTAALETVVETPGDISGLAALIEVVQEPAWPLPMDEDTANGLLEGLLAGLQDDEDGNGNPSTGGNHPDPGELLQPERLRLEFPEGTERAVVEAFLNEVPDLVASFTAALEHLSRDDFTEEDLLRAQRLAHTIKGSANVTGVAAMATLMHACEELLEACHKQGFIDATTMDVAIEAGDCLAMQLDYLTGAGPAPEQISAVVERVLQVHPDIGDEAGEDVPRTWPALAGAAEATELPAENASHPDRSSSTGTSVAVGDSLRIPTRVIDGLLRQSGEVSISNVQLQGRQLQLTESARTLARQQAIVRERLAALQNLVDVKSIPSARFLAEGQAAEDRFDPLELDQYNELHSVTHALAESIVDAQQYSQDLDQQVRAFGDMLRQQDGLAQELNENVISTRLVPVGTIRSRLERVVRQTVRQTGNNARFEMDGDDTFIDRHVLDQLTEPLLHVLRNAVDHGIESPEERARLGKPETGIIRLSVRKRGDSVSLCVKDDGRGLDRDRIRAVATEKGLLDNVAAVDEAAIERLILLPGFSTREAATQISGRGIGMDVVQSRMKEQRGTVDLLSEAGIGTTITLQVPITLSSMHALLVSTSSFTIAVPSGLIEQLIFSDFGEWVEAEDGLQYLFEERTYHAVTMEALLGEPGSPDVAIPDQPMPLVLMQGIGRNYAVIVEHVAGSRDVIIKGLGRFMPAVPGVIGASILGDGGVAPVIDLRDVLGRERQALAAIPTLALEAVPDLPLVLVVDDSVSARRTLAALAADGGYRVVTAIDGLEAVEAIEEERPAAVIADLEMPRMNGLELTRHLRTNDETHGIPVMMITSRSTDKHRQHATEAGVDEYVVKPYDEDAVLESLAALIASGSRQIAGGEDIGNATVTRT